MARRIVDWDERIGRRLKLRDLQVLSVVARAGSMAKAAAQLRITQPNISQAIADLEATLGVRLLDRGPRGVTPTRYGETMLRYATEAFDSLKQGMRDIEFLSDPGVGEVWIGCSESFLAGGLLADVIQRVNDRYPRIAVHVLEANTAAMEFHELRERHVDIMLGRMSRPVVDDDLRVEVLFEEPIVAVVGAAHPLARRRKITLRDLTDQTWVLAPPKTVVRDFVGDAFKADGLEPPALGVTTYSMLLRLQLLASGRYITVFPSSLVAGNAERWPLSVLPVKLGNPLPVAAVVLKSRTLSPAVMHFMTEARAVAEDWRSRMASL